MNIYKVERPDDDSGGYDTYDSFVCFAESSEEARYLAPDPDYHMWKDGVYCYSYREQAPVNMDYSSWIKDPKKLIVTELNPVNAKTGIILASFNAG